MSVTVVLPNNRRLTVKSSANSLLSEILEKVCTSQSLDSNKYNLHRNNRCLDLGLSLRLANIPLNSELSLVFDERKVAVQNVTISMQFGDRPRKVGEFDSNTTLWHIIEHLFLNDVQEINDENSLLSINYMNRQFEGIVALQKTTLKLMGIINGRVALRLNIRPKDSDGTQKFVENIKFKKPEVKQVSEESPKISPVDVLKDAQALPQCQPSTSYSKDETSNNSIPNFSKPDPISQHFDSIKHCKSVKVRTNPSEDENMSKKILEKFLDVDQKSFEKDLHYLGGKNFEILYSFKDCPKFVEEDVPEEFFEHNANDLKHLLSELRRQQTGDSEAMLETQKLREKRKEEKEMKYSNTILRIVFPYDQLIFQGIFKPTDTIADVINVLANFTIVNDIYLFCAPPKSILKLKDSLFDLNLVPSGSIYCASQTKQQSLIKEDFQTKVSPFSSANNFAVYQMKLIFSNLNQVCN